MSQSIGSAIPRNDAQLSPVELFRKGRRAALDYSIAHALDYYLALHPEADREKVADELERAQAVWDRRPSRGDARLSEETPQRPRAL